MSFLSGTCRLGKRMILKVLEEAFSIKACVGSVSNIEARVSKALEESYEEIAFEVERTGLDGEWGPIMLGYLDKVFEMWKEVRGKKRSRRSLSTNGAMG